MKLRYLLLFLITEVMLAQAPSIQWQKKVGGSYIEYGAFVTQTSDGGYLAASTTWSTDVDAVGNHGQTDCLVVKLSSTGAVQWKKCLGGTGYEQVYSVIQASDLGYLIVCTTNSADGDVTGSHWFSECWVVKLAQDGSILWKKCYGGTGDDYGYCIQQTSDGGYIVGGSTNSTDGNVTVNHGGQDFWIIKISALGNIQWQKTYGGSDQETLSSVKQTSDGGYIITGSTSSINGDVTISYGNNDYWVVKISSSGVLQWQKSFGDWGNDSPEAILQTNDGGYIITGGTTSTQGMVTGTHGGGGFYSDGWVVKISSTGQLQWQKALGGSNDDRLRSVIQTSDGNYLMTGYTRSNDGDVISSHSNEELWLVKISNTDGHVLWQKTYGGTSDDSGNLIQQTIDGGFVLSGSSDSSNGDTSPGFGSGRPDGWVVKLTSEGLANLEFERSELKIFPNPASTTIKVHNGENQFFDRLIVSDLAGKKILEVTHADQIVIENLQSGTYLLNAFAKGVKMTTKFVKE